MAWSFPNSTQHRAEVAERLVAVARCLIRASTDSGITIEGAAIKNLKKIFDRWPRERIYPPAFDADKDTEEQLPRSMPIDIYERTVRGQV